MTEDKSRISAKPTHFDADAEVLFKSNYDVGTLASQKFNSSQIISLQGKEKNQRQHVPLNTVF